MNGSLCDLPIYVHLSCFVVASVSTLVIYDARRAPTDLCSASYLHICPITSDLILAALGAALFSPSNPGHYASLSDLYHLRPHPSAATMSFNIASDGSPTPRKGPARFPVPGDLRVDTSPEALGQAVGSMSLSQYPSSFHRVFGSTLTSNTQGLKRPLGPSALGSRSLLEQHELLDGYKVSTS